MVVVVVVVVVVVIVVHELDFRFCFVVQRERERESLLDDNSNTTAHTKCITPTKTYSKHSQFHLQSNRTYRVFPDPVAAKKAVSTTRSCNKFGMTRFCTGVGASSFISSRASTSSVHRPN